MTALTSELPLHIDSTMISCFRSCPRKFFLEFCLGLRPAAVSVDLHAGACFATAIETVRKAFYLEGLPLDGAIKKGFAAYMNAWGNFVPMKETPKTQDRVWEAVEDYFRTYSPQTDHIQPMPGQSGFEFTFGIPLLAGYETKPEDTGDIPLQTAVSAGFPLHPSGVPFIYAGRFDMLGLYNANPIVVDEKTTKSIGATWASQWDLRSQFLGYKWACEQSGLAVNQVAVRGVGILKTKISQAEAIKIYSDELVARWHEQLRRDLWRMRRMWDEGYFDYNLADACTSYGGCSFNDVCASAHPERWYEQFTVRRWNPLNKNPIEGKAA